MPLRPGVGLGDRFSLAYYSFYTPFRKSKCPVTAQPISTYPATQAVSRPSPRQPQAAPKNRPESGYRFLWVTASEAGCRSARNK